MVLFVLWVLVVSVPWLRVRWLVVGFGRRGLCLSVVVPLGSRRRRLVCSCRSIRWPMPPPLAGCWRLMASGFGFALVRWVRRCSRRVLCRFRLLWSRWLFLPVGVRRGWYLLFIRFCPPVYWFLRRFRFVPVRFAWVRWIGRCSVSCAYFVCLVTGWRACPAGFVLFVRPCSPAVRLAVLSSVAALCVRVLGVPCPPRSFAPHCYAGFVVGVVAVAGSRSLPAAFAPLVRRVVRAVVRSGHSVAVGCCVGADSFALSALPVGAGCCFAAFGLGGVGACSLSAVEVVADHATNGGSVHWWAGGSAAVALPVRLAARTHAVIGAASVSAVVFFASPASFGSLLACRLAVGRGLPVFAFPCCFAGSALLPIGAGAWVSVGSVGVWALAFRWVPAQKNIFPQPF